MPSLADIRTTFLDYFAGHGHAVVDSSPLVPRNDPTLGVGRQSVCDVEKGRALVSVEKATRFAAVLEHNEKLLVRLALQDQVAKAGLKLKVSVGDAA